MLLHPKSKNRPFHLGPFPLEALPRAPELVAAEAARPPLAAPRADVIDDACLLARASRSYQALFQPFFDGEEAMGIAPLPDDLARRSMDIKGAAYFMDASQVGICRVPENAWLVGRQALDHQTGIVVVVEHPRHPEPGNLACAWTRDAVTATAEMRVAEVAAIVAGHIRHLGFPAKVHVQGEEAVDRNRLSVLAGLAVRRHGRLVNPYLGEAFSTAVVTTPYELAHDEPLAPKALGAHSLAYWWGKNGAMSGRERHRRAARPSHLSRYPMEAVRRVERPTTLILDDEVPRVSKRGAFFERALQGDLGAKAQAERGRFATKHPMSLSQAKIIRAMVPYQDGEVTATTDLERYRDPKRNTEAIKSLSYFLGSDLTGICEIPRYAWNSHYQNGQPITPYHRYAVVMLIDQGYDTMEGASGDDWISGAQSMRGYLRGAEIAGIMAEHLRGLGFSARSQTNADSDLEHIPLILWAGLGELSRIGELVLNPFVGPRFKSVVLTTDMPLEPDKPIDFGLQYFCENCYKCARECPCDAIPFGDKVMFNGYEIWKPDVERCTRYRLTNAKGSACGRCMKTCPLNKVVDLDGSLMTRAASWLGVNAMWLKPIMVPIATRLDDVLGNGRRNLVKKWWLDLEVIDGVAVIPPKGANERELDPLRPTDPAKQKIAYYPASAMPPPNALTPFPLDRKEALAQAAEVETPTQARARAHAGVSAPTHYSPTPASPVPSR